MAQQLARPAGTLAAACSFGCLVAQVVWVALCYAFVDRADPANWLAGVAGLLGAVIGVCVLSAVGTGFGIAGRRSGWGMLALSLNALAVVGTAIPLLMFFGPLR